MSKSAILLLAMAMYDTYCHSVGGKAFNGDPLPKSEEFFNDETKAKQAGGWLAAAEVAKKMLTPEEDNDPAIYILDKSGQLHLLGDLPAYEVVPPSETACIGTKQEIKEYEANLNLEKVSEETGPEQDPKEQNDPDPKEEGEDLQVDPPLIEQEGTTSEVPVTENNQEGEVSATEKPEAKKPTKKSGKSGDVK